MCITVFLKPYLIPRRVVSKDGPVFQSLEYAASVAEDAAPGTPLTRIHAENTSPAPLIYTIYSGDPDRIFALDYDTGTRVYICCSLKSP